MFQGLSVAAMYQNLAAGSSAVRRLSVPVRPLLSPTMVFKHVIGVPARSPEESTPSFKLRLLDTLIARLIRVDKGAAQAPAATGPQLDELLTSFADRARKAEAARRPFSSGLLLESGSLVNRLA